MLFVQHGCGWIAESNVRFVFSFMFVTHMNIVQSSHLTFVVRVFIPRLLNSLEISQVCETAVRNFVAFFSMMLFLLHMPLLDFGVDMLVRAICVTLSK